MYNSIAMHPLNAMVYCTESFRASRTDLTPITEVGKSNTQTELNLFIYILFCVLGHYENIIGQTVVTSIASDMFQPPRKKMKQPCTEL